VELSEIVALHSRVSRKLLSPGYGGCFNCVDAQAVERFQERLSPAASILSQFCYMLNPFTGRFRSTFAAACAGKLKPFMQLFYKVDA